MGLHLEGVFVLSEAVDPAPLYLLSILHSILGKVF